MHSQTEIPPEELAADINEQVGQIGNDARLDRTRKIKDSLWKLAPKYGATPQATRSRDADDNADQDLCHEFLLDMIWWKREAKQYTGVALAAECEMERGLSDREKDFRKLLASKSPLKLMIVVEQDDSETAQFVSELDKVMRAWKAHAPNEQYLLFVFAGPKNKALPKGKTGPLSLSKYLSGTLC